MKYTISALAVNKPGVLAELTVAFGENNLNIRSISAGETENPEISRIVIGLEGSKKDFEACSKVLEANEHVTQLDDLSRRDFVDRELLLVKVGMNKDNTSQLMQMFEVFRANVVGMGTETITIEMAADAEKVEALIKMLIPHGIRSLCRSGTIALKRGDE